MKGEPLNILHVEDNPDHAHLVKRSLRKYRVANRICLLEDGEAALEYLFHRGSFREPENSPRPDLVLLDLRLPKVDGLEVLRIIKSTGELQQIPVVILTSSEAERDVAQAYECHANSYLVKPVGFDQFTDMMEQLGFYWLGWNHFPWAASVL
ncbi:MAG: response regulator [Pirellulales bacterium]|nr:response regulator [Pirellulales bacterium]